MSIAHHTLLSGTTTRPKPILLRAGPLTAVFEQDIAFLRQVKLGDIEILAAIYGAVRDHQWKTITLNLGDWVVEAGADSFRISFKAECQDGAVDFTWRGEVTGSALGEIRFSFEGLANADFMRNRIGLCILHSGTECPGKRLQVEFADGTSLLTRFPGRIHPTQPFTNIARMRHEITPGHEAEVVLTGDVFEMEDQRNYADMSYKVYSTSVTVPYPALIGKGEWVKQSALLRLITSKRGELPIASTAVPKLSLDTKSARRRPTVGLQLAEPYGSLTSAQAEAIRALGLDHVRVDIRLDGEDWEQSLALASRDIEALKMSAELGVFVSLNATRQIPALVAALAKSKLCLLRVMLLSPKDRVTPQALIAAFLAAMESVGMAVPVAIGTHGNLVDITQSRPAFLKTLEELSGISPTGQTLFVRHPVFQASPQIHAFDTTTMMENNSTLPTMASEVESWSPHLSGAIISPITLKPFTRAFETNDSQAGVDARQYSLFAATWTVGSLARLLPCPSANSATYFETTGLRGVVANESELKTAPSYFALAALEGCDEVTGFHSSHQLLVDGLALGTGGKIIRILCANLQPEPRLIDIETGSESVFVKVLDAKNIEAGVKAPKKWAAIMGTKTPCPGGVLRLELGAYALGVIHAA